MRRRSYSGAQRAIAAKPTLAQLAKHNESMRKIGVHIRAENLAYKARVRAEDEANKPPAEVAE
jgi:hypothetical protein